MKFSHILRAGTISLVSLVLLSVRTSDVALAAKTITASDLHYLSNSLRSRESLPPYTYNNELAAAAQAKAEDMVERHYFEHTAPDGTTGWSFIQKTTYKLAAAGENLAISNSTAIEITNNWFKSQSHRANLLSASYQDVGYGIAKVGDWNDETGSYKNMFFVVALYAAPATAGTITTPIYTNGGIGKILLKNPAQALSDISYFLAGSAFGIVAGLVLIRKLLARTKPTPNE